MNDILMTRAELDTILSAVCSTSHLLYSYKKIVSVIPFVDTRTGTVFRVDFVMADRSTRIFNAQDEPSTRLRERVEKFLRYNNYQISWGD
jgi:hypothetical protein